MSATGRPHRHFRPLARLAGRQGAAWSGLWVLLLAFLLPFTGTDAGRAQTVPTVLRIGLDAVAGAADPHAFNSADTRNLAFHIFEPLILPDQGLGLQPWLATGWQQEDARHWALSLRPGVRFHDGKPLTAADVAFTFCRLDQVADGTMTGLIAGVEEVAARDATSVVITTRTPVPLLPHLLTLFGIVPAPEGWHDSFRPGGCNTARAALADMTAERFEQGRVPGTGPFRLERFTRGGPVDLVAVDGYWGRRPAWERVRLVPIVTGAARARALVAGEVDIINQVVPESLEFLSSRPDIRLTASQPMRTLMLNINPYRAGGAGALLQSATVRRALAISLDRGALARRLSLDATLAAPQMMPPDIVGHTPDADLPYDPDQARAQLRQASGGQPIRLDLVTVEPFARVAEGITRYFLAVGVTLNIRYIPVSEVLRTLNGGDYDLFLSSWVPFTGELGYPGWEMLHTRDPALKAGAQNFGRYSNPTIDHLLEEARGEQDLDRRTQLLQQVSILVSQDAPLIPLLHLARRWAMRADLRFDGRVDGNTLATLIAPATTRTQ